MSGQPTEQELLRASEWCDITFADAAKLPFSFKCDGNDSRTFLDSWTRETTTGGISFRDPAAGLVCSCEITRFDDFPAVEWLVRFTNEGSEDTPIISDVQALDVAMPFGEEPVMFHGAKGSLYRNDDFAATESVIEFQKVPVKIGSHEGRSSAHALPFFNISLDKDDQWGVIGAIGWTGRWEAEFELAEERAVQMRACMPDTHLALHPGESIRTPRIMLLFWESERIHGHNMLRRFIVKNHTPNLGDYPENAPEAPLSWAVWGQNPIERQLMKIGWMADNDIGIDNFWIDAGWHGDMEKTEKATVFNTKWGEQVGNWWPNEPNYPDGLKPVGDLAREKGMRFTLWFEPERIHKDTKLAAEHPEWMLSRPGDDSRLVNLGIPEARQFVTEMISKVITDSGVTLYRQDFNMDPQGHWRENDTPDRMGMTEIRHIEGLYIFWDDLLERHPGLVIDNCASGGRRLDLETTGRSIPLWRSDLQCFRGYDPIGMQSQTHGLSMWLPLSTGSCDRQSTYLFRCSILPGTVISTALAGDDEPEGYRTPWDNYDLEWLKKMLAEQRAVSAYACGDFYPLMGFTLADDTWAVWQFDRPDIGEGAVIALRRRNSPFPSMEMCLKGLDADVTYTLYSFDDDSTEIHSGSDLMSGKLLVEIGDKPGSRLYSYKRV
jgi:alpha-galactosidase